MSVANGVTDINDIQQLYDGSVGHRFDDAGKIRTITTSGNGYIPPIKQEAIIDAAFDYATGNGEVPIDVVRKRLYDNLYPYSYTSPVTRVHNAVVNNKKEPRIVRNIPDRDDIFAEYLQIPENERHHLPGTMYVRDSEYAPTMGGTNNVKYKKLDLTDAQKEKIILATNSLNFGENRLSKIKHKFDEAKSKPRKYTDTQAAAMVLNSYFGEYTLGKGLDPQKGEYRSYYDLWDLSPVSTYGKDETRGIGKPVPFYDRIYLSDYYGVKPQLLLPPKGDYFGKWLPELVVTNKKALGGHLYKNAGPLDKSKSQPKYQYGIIEQILRENGVNFRVTSGARKPNQAGNAGKSSAHTYTIFGNSPGAIDIVPGVGSDWNTLFTQMNSPKVRRALAMYGLDILNETNPSVMASTHATGPHLHVGRGIKGQSGTGQMFGGTSFGGGRGSYTIPQYSTAGSDSYASMMQQQAMEPITLAGSNTTSPWLDYISKIGQQRPVAFNTPIGTPNEPTSNGQINIGPVDFSNIGKADELMSFINPYTSKQALEYNLGLENNALWNSPYLLFNEHSAANGGHIYDDGSMLIKNNAVNPLMQYVYGDEYEDIIRRNRNYRPSGIQRKSKPRYNIEQQADVVARTATPAQRAIRQKQITGPTRQQEEQRKADENDD
jgi:hypothetical protein